MLSHDREVWYLYNGVLMDDVGDQMTPQPRLFTSLDDAKEWAARQDFDIEIKAGVRRGDRIEELKKYFCATCGRVANTQERCHELLMVQR